MNNNLKNMSFKELKILLESSKGTPNELPIRQVMKEKYIKHINKKKLIDNIYNLSYDDFISDTQNNNNDSEIKKDTMNNNLMTRLNSDICIKKMMKQKLVLPIAKPYNDVNNKYQQYPYTPFDAQTIIPNADDFTKSSIYPNKKN